MICRMVNLPGLYGKTETKWIVHVKQFQASASIKGLLFLVDFAKNWRIKGIQAAFPF